MVYLDVTGRTFAVAPGVGDDIVGLCFASMPTFEVFHYCHGSHCASPSGFISRNPGLMMVGRHLPVPTICSLAEQYVGGTHLPLAFAATAACLQPSHSSHTHSHHTACRKPRSSNPPKSKKGLKKKLSATC
jgi:hypothetical protein